MEIVKTIKKIPRSRRVVLTLPETFKVGEVIQLTVVITSGAEHNVLNSRKRKLDLGEWAKMNAVELGAGIDSTDVESFTGREF